MHHITLDEGYIMDQEAHKMITAEDITQGLQALGLQRSSTVVVHTSLRSFGPIEGGAQAVCQALLDTCGTLLLPAGTWDITGVPAPPGLLRPHNAAANAETWQEFDAALSDAEPYSDDLPIDKELGMLPEIMRRTVSHLRCHHPLLSYIAIGPRASDLMGAQHFVCPLGPFEALERLDGGVLLLGVDHTANTAIHLAEQRLGRSCFYRYAKLANQVWMELPNIPGQSHRFDDIEPELRAAMREAMIGSCRARLIPVREVLATADRLIRANPAALLCEQLDCRCYAALQQRLEMIANNDE